MYPAYAAADLAVPQFPHLYSGDAAPHVTQLLGGLIAQLILNNLHSSWLTVVDTPVVSVVKKLLYVVLVAARLMDFVHFLLYHLPASWGFSQLT